jgi:outer membrane receptor protein involved in Fe transport
LVLAIATPASAQTTGGLTGQIIDAQTQNPVADAVVIATSPALQGEQTAVTDTSGTFEITLLPAGTYTINVQREGYQPFTQTGLTVRLDKTIKIRLQLVPEAVQAGAVEITVAKPVIATTSETAGATISKEQMNLVPYGRANRDFAAVVQSVPGVHTDPFGATMNGAGSSESNYIIDGVQVNDPAYGTQGTTLLQDFIQEVDVKTGGYQAEYGRSTGGIVNVVTKSGGNEFHGSVFINWSPFEATRNQIGSVFAIGIQQKQNYNLDFGVELGGPILKDKLWFYAGFAPQFISTNVDRVIQAQVDDGTGRATLGADGRAVVKEVARKTYVATQTSYQFTGKLTFLATENHSVALALYGNPTDLKGSAGNGNEGVFLGTNSHLGSVDVSLRYSGKLLNKSMLIEAGLGYHTQDGTLYTPSYRMQSVQGIAASEIRNAPAVQWRGTRNLLDPVFDDGTVPDYQKGATVLAGCTPAANGFNPCPVSSYRTGGPGYLQASTLKRIAPGIKLSNFVELLGHHQFKYGADAAFDSYDSDKYYTGGQYFRNYGVAAGNSSSALGNCGTTDCFLGVRGFAHGSPGNPNVPQLNPNPTNPYDFKDAQLIKTTNNQSFSEFIQDTWSVADKVVLDAGLRFEQQKIKPSSQVLNAQGLPYSQAQLDAATITLLNWMPRLGIIYDWTGRGLSKVYASYGRFFEYIPLDLADRSLSNEQSVNYSTNPNSCNKGMTSKAGPQAFDPRSCQLIQGGQYGTTYFPNSGAEGLDPILTSGHGWNHGQYSDQIQGGVQYQVYRDITVGVDYVHNQLGQVVEDMSADDGVTYFLSNPGVKGTMGYSVTTASGVTIVEPAPRRVYDGLTLSVKKEFSDNYLLSAAYTHASYRGNYPGLYTPDYGQLDPNITAEYDLASLLANRDGPLLGDIPNAFKVDGAYVYEIDSKTALNMGARFFANQGNPTNYLGAHELYGAGAGYVLPRGSGPRQPWNWQVDLRAALSYKMTKDYALGLNVDLFNVTNNQAILDTDQNYTLNAVYPIANGTVKDLAYLKTTAGAPVVKNLNFGNPTSYQLPFSARIGGKLSF